MQHHTQSFTQCITQFLQNGRCYGHLVRITKHIHILLHTEGSDVMINHDTWLLSDRYLTTWPIGFRIQSAGIVWTPHSLPHHLNSPLECWPFTPFEPWMPAIIWTPHLNPGHNLNPSLQCQPSFETLIWMLATIWTPCHHLNPLCWPSFECWP